MGNKEPLLSMLELRETCLDVKYKNFLNDMCNPSFPRCLKHIDFDSQGE